MNYQLLAKFRELFEGQQYRHRDSTQGDKVALNLFEDLHTIDRSRRYKERVETGLSVLNTMNRRHGVKARRGDGSFGEIVPGIDPITRWMALPETSGCSAKLHDARYRKLIEALAVARRSAGINQSDLAEKIGKRQQFVSKYESGERRLDAIELVDVCHALGLDVAHLLRDMGRSN